MTQAKPYSNDVAPPAAAGGGCATVNLSGFSLTTHMPSPASSRSGFSASQAYTGAALLAGFENRQKVLTMANALSTSMRSQVQDVIQMEEGQRVLSQASRGRRKNIEMPEETQPTLSEPGQDQKSKGPKEEASVAAEGETSKSTRDGSAASRHGPGSATEPASTAGSAALLDEHSSMSPISDVGGDMITDGSLDVKEQLEKQRKEKSDILSKLRGIHQSILELSDGVSAEEMQGRTSIYQQAATKKDEAGDAPTTDEHGDPVTDASADRGPQPSKEAKDKLEMIRYLRETLKEMLDAHRAPFETNGPSGGSGDYKNTTELLLPGLSWLAEDASYRPPPPPRAFSTNAFALTLEYISSSIACIVRIADEICVLTTYRARSDRVLLVPYLSSLQRWMRRLELCLATAEKHRRHFESGETALVEGGALEINSLREQTLSLRDSLTSQEEKMKSLAEVRSSVLHRLRNLNRCCYLWEAYLLHRVEALPADAVVSVGAQVEGSSDVSAPASSIAHTTPIMSMMLDPSPNMALATNTVLDASQDISAFSTGHMSVHTEAFSMSPTKKDTSLFPAANVGAHAHSSATRYCFPGTERTFRNSAELMSQWHSSPSQSTLSQTSRLTSACNRKKITSSLQQIEQRVAREWCNPYIRKQQLRELSEQAFERQQHHRQQQKQLQAQAAVQQWSGSRVSPAVSGDKGSVDNLISEVGWSSVSHSAGMASLESPRYSRSMSHTPEIISSADVLRGRVSLGQLALPIGVGSPRASVEAMLSCSRLSDFLAMIAPGSSPVEGALGHLADVRVIQLLRGFQHSVSRPRKSISHDDAANVSSVKGQDGKTMAPSRLSKSLVSGASADENLQPDLAHSMQRISRYLTVCTTRVERKGGSVVRQQHQRASSRVRGVSLHVGGRGKGEG